ncbi:MAG: hypothetical protein HRT69_06335 [Flavobacteriaceae bacterium]|nr:hypothetical protein [Flavobacteriaceae bacterium]PHS09228.1 MAG: hypothetical protein COA88_05405 [Kordia sp.]
MSNETEKIDALIKEALTKEEAKFYTDLDEQNLFQMLGGLFEGKMKWIILIMNIVIMSVFGFFIYCGIQFFNTDVTNELIKWGVAGTFCMLIISMLKLFLWNQMDKNSLKRELKRIELQISFLANKMEK